MLRIFGSNPYLKHSPPARRDALDVWLKNYSKAIEHGELALDLVKEGIELGPGKEPDGCFFPFVIKTDIPGTLRFRITLTVSCSNFSLKKFISTLVIAKVFIFTYKKIMYRF